MKWLGYFPIALLALCISTSHAQRLFPGVTAHYNSQAVSGSLSWTAFDNHSNSVMIRTSSSHRVTMYNRDQDSIYNATLRTFGFISGATWDNEGNVYISADAYGVYKSSDLGYSWTVINDGLDIAHVQCLARDSTGVILAGTFNGLYKLDSNDVWHKMQTDLLLEDFDELIILPNGSYLSYNTVMGIYVSIDNGASWSRHAFSDVSPTYIYYPVICQDRSGNTFAYVGYNKYVSTDNGGTWTADGTTATRYLRAVYTLDNAFVYMTSNNKVNYEIPTGSTPETGYYLYATSSGTYTLGASHIYIDSDGIIYFDGGKLRSAWSVTDVSGPDEQSYALSSSYPNPVQPGSQSMSVSYTLPSAADVSCSIYNLLGEKVYEQSPGTQAAGSHTLSLQLPSLRSGMYFYRLTTGATTETKKFIVR